MKKRLISSVLIFVLLVFALSGCVSMSNKNPVVTVTMDETSPAGVGGSFQIELYPDKAPNSVKYFIQLLREEYYDEFYVIKAVADSIVAFGDPWFYKKNKRVIEGEFEANGFEGNDIKFERGVIGYLLVEDDNNSAQGDFFIVLEDEIGSYNGKFAAFGRVVDGIEVVEDISHIKTSSAIDYQPVYTCKTKTATVDLKGQTYAMPDTKKRTKYPFQVDDDFLNDN